MRDIGQTDRVYALAQEFVSNVSLAESVVISQDELLDLAENDVVSEAMERANYHRAMARLNWRLMRNVNC